MIKVVDKGWNEYIRKTLSCDDKYSKVGYPENSTPQTSGSAEEKRTMQETIEIAMVHEFGAPKQNIPMRSHVRETYDEDVDNLAKRSAREVDLILTGKSTPGISLARLGEYHSSKIKQKIKTGDFKPLKPETVKKKGSSKPLIDTAQMLQSITHVEK